MSRLRRSLLAATIVASVVVAGVVPAVGHTNYGHSHTCKSSHPIELDSSSTKHNAGVINSNTALVVAWHRTWHAQDGGYWGPWYIAHSHYIYC